MSTNVGVATRNRKMLGAATVLIIAVLSIQVYWTVSGAHIQTSIPPAKAAVQPKYNSTISVSGFGQVNIQPDRAILEIGVTTQNSTAEGAAERNAYLMNGIISALEAIGVSNSSIKTTSYSINPVYSCCGGQPTVTGYAVSNQLEVTVLNTGTGIWQLGTRVGQVIDAAVSHGANQVYGVQFSASEQTMAQAREQALKLAVKDAAAQATAIADSLGVNITGVVSATTTSFYYPAPVFQSVASTAPSATPVIPPQSLTVSASVSVTYSIN